MKLVDNWKKSWQWFSMQVYGLLIALPVVWVSLPADVKAYIPNKYGWIIVTVLAVAGAIGRLIDQNKAK